MAEKLKSISRQIHWSLLLRAALFALAWFFLPFWLFLLVALYLYLIPFFNSRRLFWPFFALLVLTYLEPGNLVYLIFFAAFFYYLLLIKNLLLIDRKSAYELLVLALSFFLIRSFYEQLGTGLLTAASLWYGFLLAVLIGFLVGSFIRYFSENAGKDPVRRLSAWLVFILVWQFLSLGLFLPLDFVYQSAVVFLASVLVIDLVPEHSSERSWTVGATVCLLLVIVVLSAHWGL
jgi:hypothetical protein